MNIRDDGRGQSGTVPGVALLRQETSATHASYLAGYPGAVTAPTKPRGKGQHGKRPHVLASTEGQRPIRHGGWR